MEEVAADLMTTVDMRTVEFMESDVQDAVIEIHRLRHDLGRFVDQLTQLIDDPEIPLSSRIHEEFYVINTHAKQIDRAVARLTGLD